MPPAEIFLWNVLKNKQINLHNVNILPFTMCLYCVILEEERGLSKARKYMLRRDLDGSDAKS
ncbi:hypothetical protein KKF04_00460, partial [Patescibacteria group bacterium]|nr:hypothetical protein [Patescibacteria group bacterium]